MMKSIVFAVISVLGAWCAQAAEKCTDCITFSAEAPFGIQLYREVWEDESLIPVVNLEWSTNGVDWAAVTVDTDYPAGPDNTISFRGSGNTTFADYVHGCHVFCSTESSDATKIACSGNILTLLDWQTVKKGEEPVMGDYSFYALFWNFAALTTAPELPAKSLSAYCYSYTFENCSSLTTAPELPAKTMAYRCYEGMFYNCTSLTTAPELPADTLAEECYCWMFSGCSTLTNAPALLATELPEFCYYEMFRDCVKLAVNESAPGVPWKIPAESPTAEYWGYGMFTGTSGDLTGQPELNKTYYVTKFVPPACNDFITFSADAPFGIKMTKNGDSLHIVTVDWSTNRVDWTEIEPDTVYPAGPDNRIYFRGRGNIFGFGNILFEYYGFAPSSDSEATAIYCSGDVMSLIDWETVAKGEQADVQLYDNAFYRLFADFTTLKTPPELSAMLLDYDCYREMFSNCMSLMRVPKLPATNLWEGCYRGMFSGCTSLVVNESEPGTPWSVSVSNPSWARDWGGDMFAGTSGALTGCPESDKTYYVSSTSANVAKAVVENEGATLRFVFDEKDYGTKDVDWFSVAEAEQVDLEEAPVAWYALAESVTNVVFDVSFLGYRPNRCCAWFLDFEKLLAIEDLANLDTSAVTDLSYLFKSCLALETLDVSGFDTAEVTNMDSLFYKCYSLTELDVSGFKTDKVTNMSGMFGYCRKLSEIDVSGFKTAAVDDMCDMFYDCTVLKSVDLSGFDTSLVEDMEDMFALCKGLTELDLSSFNTESLECMDWMFEGCSSLKTIYVSEAFVMDNVEDDYEVFAGCTSLVGGNGTPFDSENIDGDYARIDGKDGLPGYFTLKSAGGFASWAAEKGLTGADAAWDAKPACWGGTWANAFIYTFGEGLADGSVQLMSISFDADLQPIVTTTSPISGHDDFTLSVIGATSLADWTSPVLLESSDTTWTLPAGESANFFRVRLSE